MWKKALATSEFWMAILGAVLQVLVDQHLLSAQVQSFVLGIAAYVLGRLISKTAKAAPGVPPAAMLALMSALLLALMLGCASVAKAEPVSLLHPDRKALGAGAGVDWHTADPAPPVGREVTVSGHGAWVAGHLALAAHAVAGLGSGTLRAGPEVRWRFDLGPENVAVALGYEFHAGREANLPGFRHEWQASAYYARPLWQKVSIGLSETYGFDNKRWTTALGVRVPLAIGKDH